MFQSCRLYLYSLVAQLVLVPEPGLTFVASPGRAVHQAVHHVSSGYICKAGCRRSSRSTSRHGYDGDIGAIRSLKVAKPMSMVGDRAASAEQTKPLIESAPEVPRGPAGSIRLTSLEGNSLLCEVNGLNFLVDPVFDTVDFGLPALIKVKKRVLRDGGPVLRELSAVTDCVVLTQGLDDHCNERTIEPLARLLDPSIPVIAPPSARPVLERHFPAKQITYLLPGDDTVVSTGDRAVSVLATTGGRVGPPWQQEENGYLLRPAGDAKGGRLYLEPHLMFDAPELSGLKADVIIGPAVAQLIGAYTLVAGGPKLLDLASTLKASKVFVLSNAAVDLEGPLGGAARDGNTLESVLQLAERRGVELIVPEPLKPVVMWP